jgi:hypothetical protein
MEASIDGVHPNPRPTRPPGGMYHRAALKRQREAAAELIAATSHQNTPLPADALITATLGTPVPDPRPAFEPRPATAARRPRPLAQIGGLTFLLFIVMWWAYGSGPQSEIVSSSREVAAPIATATVPPIASTLDTAGQAAASMSAGRDDSVQLAHANQTHPRSRVPAASADTRLVISSNPPGAWVTVDGVHGARRRSRSGIFPEV